MIMPAHPPDADIYPGNTDKETGHLCLESLQGDGI